jgi:hypothetical protein
MRSADVTDECYTAPFLRAGRLPGRTDWLRGAFAVRDAAAERAHLVTKCGVDRLFAATDLERVVRRGPGVFVNALT